MRAVAALLIAGCYGPKVPDGVRCDPAAPACPSGQSCVTSAAGSICTASSGPDAPIARDAAVDAAPDAPPDAQTQFLYVANIAACINPVAAPPDPAACATSAGANAVRVDADDGGHPWDTFLRFHIDTAIAGRTVTAVHLQLTASMNPNSNSDSSGSVYESVAFSSTDLTVAEPAKANPAAIAPSQGSVQLGATVVWPLPKRLGVAGTNVYLEVETASIDAVIYDNRSGLAPPMLIIDTQ
ncbi:MAG: hypothetical protein JO257_22560 [Deltaproteobacteria bacterium]|nr:hypothetical protein [Deltaproteobacteria bacterium]